jgi:hypothetical protein
MTTFKVYNLDEPVWQKLTDKIGIIKKNTKLEIEESSELQKRKKHAKTYMLKWTRASFFIFFILLFTTVFLFFNGMGFSFVGFLLVLVTGFTFICSVASLSDYYKSYQMFDKRLIASRLNDNFVDQEELALLKKFMSTDSLEKLLANNNLKLTLANADYILNCDYYQDYYNEKMAEEIVNKL